MADYLLHQCIIFSLVVVFSVFGLFGNLHLIVLHLRKRSLRTTYGILLMWLTICQSFCLLYEWVNVGFGVAAIFFGTVIRRDVCFRIVFPFVFLHCCQTGLVAVIATDFLVAIVFPLAYRTIKRSVYVPLLLFPVFSFGVYSVSLGFIYLNNDVIMMCNPPSSLHPTVASRWYFLSFLAGGFTLVAYIISFSTLYCKGKTRQNALPIERKAMHSLSLLLIIFLVTRFFGLALVNALGVLHVEPETIALARNYNVIFALTMYSQNGYVCFLRSSEYRRMLAEQVDQTLRCCLPCWLGSLRRHLKTEPSNLFSRVSQPNFTTVS